MMESGRIRRLQVSLRKAESKVKVIREVIADLKDEDDFSATWTFKEVFEDFGPVNYVWYGGGIPFNAGHGYDTSPDTAEVLVDAHNKVTDRLMRTIRSLEEDLVNAKLKKHSKE